MMKKFFKKNIAVFLLLQYCICFSSSAQINAKCYPTNWWAGMKWDKVQLMLHADSGFSFTDKFTLNINYPGIKVEKINKVENKHYLFVDILIAPNTRAGLAFINVNTIVKSNTFKIPFEIKERRKGKGTNFAQGVTSKDFIYLVLPDRFSNGDPSNDRIPGMRDQSLNRDTVFNRHGGDLKGIQNHLDYIQNLGVTTIWLNPVLENDRFERTEHGYAFTDHYKIDRRLGGEKAYQNLIDASHKKGLKIIQDAVYNHVDESHITVLDMPTKDWLNTWPTFTKTTYKDQVAFDPYASAIDKKKLVDGWQTSQMPDLNQTNPYVANYLIQHALWTVEEFGIDGWRVDTYAYNDLGFMNRCNNALTSEYPSITIFGETWYHGVPNQAYFVQNNLKHPASNLQGATDFQTLWGIQDAMTRNFGWTDGVNNLYTTLAQDFLYKDPTKNVLFLDNHDIARFYSVVGEDIDKYKSSLSWLFTCRGIPQMYYTSELATTGITSPSDGYVRLDFPGGWEGDKVNKFEASGRTAKDNDIWNHVFALANFRKNSSALTTGKLMQYVPKDDGVYVYFRYDVKQTVMVVMNTAKTDKVISFGDYAERTKGFSQYTNIVTKEKSATANFTLGSYKTVVLELNK